MGQDEGQRGAAQIAACTAEAVHRRDHHHDAASACHPHAVEVVHLGRRALAVCHDCGEDSGFLPEREAEAVAVVHREQTRGADSSPLSSAVA